ncbi:MAG: hypothetical protein CL424_06335 [Acidimicrobiaceae bacterium]|nr:hypothetical protein [Acidimicrobiaceae bacterium]
MADDPTSDRNIERNIDADFADIEALLRDLDASDLELETPPDTIWQGIAEQLDLDETRASGGAPVLAAPFGRRRSWMVPLTAAAAVIVIIAVSVLAVTGSPSSTELASAELSFAPGFDPVGAEAEASAALVDDDGAELIRIDDDQLPFELDEDASLELWLIEADADGNVVDLVSLGDIEADGDRTFPVPEGYDPAVFTVVDISIEPHDGDPTHSGRSILRGALTA